MSFMSVILIIDHIISNKSGIKESYRSKIFRVQITD